MKIRPARGLGETITAAFEKMAQPAEVVEQGTAPQTAPATAQPPIATKPGQAPQQPKQPNQRRDYRKDMAAKFWANQIEQVKGPMAAAAKLATTFSQQPFVKNRPEFLQSMQTILPLLNHDQLKANPQGLPNLVTLLTQHASQVGALNTAYQQAAQRGQQHLNMYWQNLLALQKSLEKLSKVPIQHLPQGQAPASAPGGFI